MLLRHLPASAAVASALRQQAASSSSTVMAMAAARHLSVDANRTLFLRQHQQHQQQLQRLALISSRSQLRGLCSIPTTKTTTSTTAEEEESPDAPHSSSVPSPSSSSESSASASSPVSPMASNEQPTEAGDSASSVAEQAASASSETSAVSQSRDKESKTQEGGDTSSPDESAGAAAEDPEVSVRRYLTLSEIRSDIVLSNPERATLRVYLERLLAEQQLTTDHLARAYPLLDLSSRLSWYARARELIDAAPIPIRLLALDAILIRGHRPLFVRFWVRHAPILEEFLSSGFVVRLCDFLFEGVTNARRVAKREARGLADHRTNMSHQSTELQEDLEQEEEEIIPQPVDDADDATLPNYREMSKSVLSHIARRKDLSSWAPDMLASAMRLGTAVRGLRWCIPLFRTTAFSRQATQSWLTAIHDHHRILTSYDFNNPAHQKEAGDIVIEIFSKVAQRKPFPQLLPLVDSMILRRVVIPTFSGPNFAIFAAPLPPGVRLQPLARNRAPSRFALLKAPPQSPPPGSDEYLIWWLKEASTRELTLAEIPAAYAGIASYAVAWKCKMSRAQVRQILRGLECVYGQPPTTDMALRFWEYLRADHDNPDFQLSNSELCLVLKTLGGSPQVLGHAMHLCEGWVFQGGKLDSDIGQIVLRICSRSYFSKTIRVLRMLEHQKVPMTPPMLQSLMLQAFHQREPDLMLTFWQEFEHRGLTPDPGAFTLLIRGMAFANHELAFQLNERLVETFGYTARNTVGLLLHASVEMFPNRLERHVHLWNQLAFCYNPRLRPAAVHRLMTTLMTHGCWQALSMVLGFAHRTRMVAIPLIGRLAKMCRTEMDSRQLDFVEDPTLKLDSIRLPCVPEPLDLSILWRAEEHIDPVPEFWNEFINRGGPADPRKQSFILREGMLARAASEAAAVARGEHGLISAPKRGTHRAKILNSAESQQ